MKSIKYVFLVWLLTACVQSENKVLNVLLVGNSSIYFNNMPKMLEQIATENGVELRTRLIAYGGYTLQNHLDNGEVDIILDSLKWDYVVLNEQSTLGENYIVNGRPSVRESTSFYKTVRELDSKIKQSKAKTVIISLYARKNAPIQDGEMLDYSYMKIAKELKMSVAPVSTVWREIQEQNSDWQLYCPDNLHPTALGSFVTASVLYSTITGNISKPIEKNLYGTYIEKIDGYEHKDSIVSLIKIDTDKSKIISDFAYKQVYKLHEAGGYLPHQKPN
ncbi:SGNH/GDSL hydrolase family protein [Aurantibacter crassamenti]|uniref:SGNH/GDSL hydrolase family protein n=1 Tax=Aurantibacter crassamenti TaxID=1837375 RepID=UPI00193ABC2B|nr:SGNH/GDSL hydrolase family protein [Aurantibacter crassamenti]MBM1107706.1 SGNH/GDSL hydrolase family protein [Aurantibacter crassamenti]